MNNLINKVKAAAVDLGLPVNYKSDLDIDLATLEKHGSKVDHWVLILRTNGSNILPCSVGSSDGALTCFEDIKEILFIDTTAGIIEPIGKAEALLLVNGSLCSKHSLKTSYIAIMERGIDLDLWGVFTRPTIEQLSDPRDALIYFSQAENKAMINHCKRVIMAGIEF